MNTIFQTSRMFTYTKIDDDIIPHAIDNHNFLRELKDHTHIHHLLFVCSDPTQHSKTDSYAYNTLKAFLMSGFTIDKMTVVDDRITSDISTLVNDSDVIYLCGGSTPTQMKYFNSIHLKEILHSVSDKIIIGQSAGAMNLAHTVYNSPEIIDMDTVKTTYYDGLDFTDISIEPHFDITNRDYITKVLLKDSITHPFIALTDNAFIVKDTFGTRLYGEAYAIFDGILKKINDDDTTLFKLPENISRLFDDLRI